jgi:gold/copper resistance efflux pump
VVAAICEQNMQVAAGSVGQPPDVRSAQQLPLSVAVVAFGDIVLRTGPHGDQLALCSVARIELGASRYALRSLLGWCVPAGVSPTRRAAALRMSDKDKRVTATAM